MKRHATVVLAASFLGLVFAQSSTWCGKHYMPNQTVVPPGGQFQLPASSTEPLVAFRCAPVFRPYLEEDAKDAAFIVDAPIVHQYIQGAWPISPPSSGSGCEDLGSLDVAISIGDQVFARQTVPLNTTGHHIPVDIRSLTAQKASYNVTCSATYSAGTSSTAQYFSANASLLYLPDTQGSVVKTDLRTGALWVRPLDGKGGAFEPFIPQGFYVSFEQQLAKNLSLIDQLKADGFNTIHPIPPYGNATVFKQVLDKTVDLGLYMIYDVRSDYQNATAVAEHVQAYRALPNLLLWETAHEPDGNSDAFDAARRTYDLIYEMDGYHPVSIVLNCQDYDFAPYVAGADIVLEDAYPVGINATYSTVWHTACTPDFGHCGCDECQGSIYDIEARIQTFKERLNVLGYDRTKAVWTTPQAIGSGAYWYTTPMGQQWVAMGITSFNHGATGSVSFQYPTTTVDSIATRFTRVVAQTVQRFLVDPRVTHRTFAIKGVDAGLWFDGTTYLLLVARVDGCSSEVHVAWRDVGLDGVGMQVREVFSVEQQRTGSGVIVGPGGVGVYTATLGG